MAVNLFSKDHTDDRVSFGMGFG
jgi:hypothetical protein